MTTPPPRASLSRPPAALRLGLVAVVASSCAAPDRPPSLPEPLPASFRAYAPPDSFRAVRVEEGVWYRYVWSAVGPWAIHLLDVDLRRCELGLDVVRAAREAGKPGGHASVTQMAAMVDDPSVLAGVNGDFFTPEGVPLGPELAEGRLRTLRSRPALAWRPGRRPWIGTAVARGDTALSVGWTVPAGVDSVVGEVVGGFPELLDHGRRVGDLLVEERPAFAASRHPRTAVGYDPARNRLWLVVVAGRLGSHSVGMTLPELTGLFEALHVPEALNLDGGGSSVMVIRGRAVSRPSEETGERPVVNALLLRRNPGLCGEGDGGR